MHSLRFDRPIKATGNHFRRKGSDRFGKVVLLIEPTATPDLSFAWEVPPDQIPPDYRDAIYAGVTGIFESGQKLEKFECTHTQVRVIGGACWRDGSSPLCFTQAAQLAFLDALRQLDEPLSAILTLELSLDPKHDYRAGMSKFPVFATLRTDMPLETSKGMNSGGAMLVRVEDDETCIGYSRNALTLHRETFRLAPESPYARELNLFSEDDAPEDVTPGDYIISVKFVVYRKTEADFKVEEVFQTMPIHIA